LAGSTIGIKIADGSYYPVLEERFTGTKRLTLTTVKDGQDRVQIDLYRGEGNTLDHAQYVGSLVIESIPPAPQGEPEIELILGVDAAGEMTAEASDRSTGESQVFSTSIQTLAEAETYEEPEFAVEPDAAAGDGAAKAESDEVLDLGTDTGSREGAFDEVPLTGDTYPVSGADRRRVPLHHRAPGRRAGRPALVAILVVLAIALLAALGYVAWRLIWGPPIPALSTLIGDPAAVEPAAPEPSAAVTTAAAAATADQPTGSSSSAPAASPAAAPAAAAAPAQSAATAPAAGTSPASGKGVTYRIRRGDTLWDISSTYYRNPWLYPVIARANSIKNPDLIIAGARIFIPEQ